MDGPFHYSLNPMYRYASSSAFRGPSPPPQTPRPGKRRQTHSVRKIPHA